MLSIKYELHLNSNTGSSLKGEETTPCLTDGSNGFQVSLFCLKWQQICKTAKRNYNSSVKKTRHKDRTTAKLCFVLLLGNQRLATKREQWAWPTQRRGNQKHMETTLNTQLDSSTNAHKPIHTNTKFYKWVEQLLYEMKGEYFMTNSAKFRLQLQGYLEW